MRLDVSSWLARVALLRGGVLSRFAAVWLSALVARHEPTAGYGGRSDRLGTWMGCFAAAGRVACSAPDRRSRERVLRAFARWDEGNAALRRLVLYGLRTGSEMAAFDGRERVHELPPEAMAFLVAPAPGCPHRPQVRVVEYLSGDDPPLPAPGGTLRWDIADWLVDIVLRAPGEPPALLRETDQPDLLAALHRAFGRALGNEKDVRRHRQSPYRLWRAGRPTELTEILRANPHLPLPLPSGPEAESRLWGTGGSSDVLLAVLTERDERLPPLLREWGGTAVDALLRGLELAAPPVFAEGCRRALRELPPGPARERICQAALTHDEARAAAADAGYLPAEERDALAFLFSTAQWERYDRADPDGTLLREYCAVHATNYASTSYRGWIEAAARRHARPDPCPPLPERPARPPDRPSGPIGSWPTNPGSGHGVGGHF